MALRLGTAETSAWFRSRVLDDSAVWAHVATISGLRSGREDVHEEDRRDRLRDSRREPRAHADGRARRRISRWGGWRARRRQPAPPPMPSVVQYPHGRYELRGDGTTVPYTWVWIPNPPPPPPPAGAPPAPPAMEEPAPERHSQLYRWTDAQGVAHWTDRWDAVPPQYRAQATQPRTS